MPPRAASGRTATPRLSDRSRAGSAVPAASAPDSAGQDPVVEAIAPKLERRIQDMLREHRIPGASAGIVRNGRLAWAAGCGYADLDTERRPDADTVYRVASISKTVTATAILQLRDRGLLSLDDPLARHIPEFGAARARHGQVAQVTLRRLLSHRSGLMSEGPFAYWDSMQFPTMEEILRGLPETEIVLGADAGAKYSNLAFALLGEVVARLAATPFPEYTQRAIFSPLGMTSSSFAPDDALLARLATGYGPHPFEDRPEPAGHTLTNGVAAAAGLYTTVADLARWILFQLTAAPAAVGAQSSPTDDEAPPDHSLVLAPRTLDEMHLPQAIDPDWQDARCLGWAGRRRSERVVIGHGGSIHGFITQVFFHKSSGTGVVVLTNEGRHQAAAPTALDLLDLVLDEAKRQPQPAPSAPPAPTPSHLRRFLGRYLLWGGALSQVEYREGTLKLMPAPPEQVALHAPARLAPTEDPLVFRVTQGRAAGELVRFQVGEATQEGEPLVSGFSLSGFRYTKLG